MEEERYQPFMDITIIISIIITVNKQRIESDNNYSYIFLLDNNNI